jgi:hypothetical protein
MFEPNFKFSTYSKRAACALFITSVMFGGPVWAQDNNNNNNGNSSNTGTKGRTYSFNDFLKYMSSFSKVPTKFTWENELQPPYETTPGRPVPPQIPQVPTSANRAADPPACLAASPPLADIYSGACSSASATIPFVQDADLTYEGTYCYGSLGSFKVSIGGGAPQDLTVNPAKRIQYKIPGALENGDGQMVFACGSLVTYPGGQPFSIPGATLSGQVVYRCQAGVWRLIEVSCSDYVLKCQAGPVGIPYTIDGITYSVNISPGQQLPNTAGPAVACTSLGDPGAGMQWIGASVGTACDYRGVWVLSGGGCGRAVIPQAPPLNTNYPNCSGPDTSLGTAIKPGLDICMSVDGTRYYWVYSQGYTPEVTQCATAGGCVQ